MQCLSLFKTNFGYVCEAIVLSHSILTVNAWGIKNWVIKYNLSQPNIYMQLIMGGLIQTLYMLEKNGSLVWLSNEMSYLCDKRFFSH